MQPPIKVNASEPTTYSPLLATSFPRVVAGPQTAQFEEIVARISPSRVFRVNLGRIARLGSPNCC